MITIALAKHPSVVPVVISSPFTCQFNILTATHLYCLYPKLLSRRETVRSMAPAFIAEVQRLVLRGVRIVKPTAEWTVSCEEACLPVWRRTEALDGAGVMWWGGYDGHNNNGPVKLCSVPEDIDFSRHKWRLGVRCSNSACRNSGNSTLLWFLFYFIPSLCLFLSSPFYPVHTEWHYLCKHISLKKSDNPCGMWLRLRWPSLQRIRGLTKISHATNFLSDSLNNFYVLQAGWHLFW
jgi:hypothetical protein